MLKSSSNPINPTALVTTFRTLAFSQSAGDGSYVVPAVIEAAFDFDVLGQLTIVTLEAPATITGHFSTNTPKSELTRVEVEIDTAALLNSMMSQVREIVHSAQLRAKAAVKNLLQATLDGKLASCNENGPIVDQYSHTVDSKKRQYNDVRSQPCSGKPSKRPRFEGLSLLTEAARGIDRVVDNLHNRDENRGAWASV